MESGTTGHQRREYECLNMPNMEVYCMHVHRVFHHCLTHTHTHTPMTADVGWTLPVDLCGLS